MRRWAILLAAFLAFAAPVVAADGCENAPDNASVLACLDGKVEAADKELDRAYEELSGLLNEWDSTSGADATRGANARFRKAHESWAAFRDDECALRAFVMDGGSAQPILEAACRETLTNERVKHLIDIGQTYGADDGGDYDEACHTLTEVVRRLADMHQYGGEANEFISSLRENGVNETLLSDYARIAAEIAESPRLLTEQDREFAVEYQIAIHTAHCG